MNNEFEVPKETQEESKTRREREDRHWNKQWALDKSIEWCKHINDLLSTNANVKGVIMTSKEVIQIADIFYDWLLQESK
jgi:hypothetical protein